jgi:hypothetical protein
METQMTPPPAHRITQLALFGERAAVPSWSDPVFQATREATAELDFKIDTRTK